MKKKRIIAIAILLIAVMVNGVPVSAVEYANYVYKDIYEFRVFENGCEKTELVYKNKTHKMCGKFKDAGIDRYGTVYVLKKGNLYGFDYKKQKKVKLIKLSKKVKKLTRSDYGYITGYKKTSGKKITLSKAKKKKLWKNAMK